MGNIIESCCKPEVSNEVYVDLMLHPDKSMVAFRRTIGIGGDDSSLFADNRIQTEPPNEKLLKLQKGAEITIDRTIERFT